MRFGKSGKLRPRLIGPFEILMGVVEVTCKFALPLNLTLAQNVFHVSKCKEYKPNKSLAISYDEIELQVDMSHGENPLKILDHKEKEFSVSRPFPW